MAIPAICETDLIKNIMSQIHQDEETIVKDMQNPIYVMTINMKSPSLQDANAQQQKKLLSVILRLYPSAIIFCREPPEKFQDEVVSDGATFGSKAGENETAAAVVWAAGQFKEEELEDSEKILEAMKKDEDVRSRLSIVKLTSTKKPPPSTPAVTSTKKPPPSTPAVTSKKKPPPSTPAVTSKKKPPPSTPAVTSTKKPPPSTPAVTSTKKPPPSTPAVTSKKKPPPSTPAVTSKKKPPHNALAVTSKKKPPPSTPAVTSKKKPPHNALAVSYHDPHRITKAYKSDLLLNLLRFLNEVKEDEDDIQSFIVGGDFNLNTTELDLSKFSGLVSNVVEYPLTARAKKKKKPIPHKDNFIWSTEITVDDIKALECSEEYAAFDHDPVVGELVFQRELEDATEPVPAPSPTR